MGTPHVVAALGRIAATTGIPAIVVGSRARPGRMKPVVVVIVRAGSRGRDHPAAAGQKPHVRPGRRVQLLVGLWRNRIGILTHREGLAR